MIPLVVTSVCLLPSFVSWSFAFQFQPNVFHFDTQAQRRAASNVFEKQYRTTFHTRLGAVSIDITKEERKTGTGSANSIDGEDDGSVPNIVLVAGFESFNRGLYSLAASKLPDKANLVVFADSDIRAGGSTVRKCPGVAGA